MKIVNISYNIPIPQYNDPEAWLMRISFSVGVLEALASHAETAAIYNINYKGVIIRRGVTYHFPNFNKAHLNVPLRFHSYVRQLHPDVIVVHGLIFPWQVLLLRWQLGSRVKIILQHHAEKPLRDIRQYLQRWADNYIHAYLFASRELAETWEAKKQIGSKGKIHEVMGTSSPFYPTDQTAARKKTGVEEGVIYLWVGSLNSNKDPFTVARAFAEFVKIKKDARLYMIYQTFDLLEQLKSLLQSYGIAENVRLVGKVENRDLQNWYNSAEFIISSSHYEGSGIAVCEAMSCGCIPVLTNIPSFRSMTGNGALGLLYEPGNSHALLNALSQSVMLDRDAERKKVLERFREHYSFEANALKIMRAINQS